MQQLFSLSDPTMEDVLTEVATICSFAGIDLISDKIPYEKTILSFRHLLEKYDLGQQIFETAEADLTQRAMAMKQGTINDATLIFAPSSSKNKPGERDPEMHQNQKGNQWCYRFAGLSLRLESAYRCTQGLYSDSLSRAS